MIVKTMGFPLAIGKIRNELGVVGKKRVIIGRKLVFRGKRNSWQAGNLEFLMKQGRKR